MHKSNGGGGSNFVEQLSKLCYNAWMPLDTSLSIESIFGKGLELAASQPLMRSIRAMLEYETGAFVEGWIHMERLSSFVNRASASMTGFV